MAIERPRICLMCGGRFMTAIFAKAVEVGTMCDSCGEVYNEYLEEENDADK